MRIAYLLLTGALLAGCAHVNEERSLPTQQNVDLKRYEGRWFEQARLLNRFQKDCAGEVRADYTLLSSDRLRVVNQCRTAKGEIKRAEGEGRLARSDMPDPARLEVRFAPSWLSWVPMVWGDYWIISTDYQYSLVGTPDRKYLWVLSRAEQADPQAVKALLDKAAGLGFAVDEMLVHTR